MGFGFGDVLDDPKVQRALGRYVQISRGREQAKFMLAKGKVLDEKIARAEEIVESCVLCQWRCKVNRKEGQLGKCRVGYKPRVAQTFAHWGEEAELIPSGTIFFTGCTWNCQYCQNWDISQHPEKGKEFSARDIADWMEHCDCINVNFVGGEPTPNLHFILKAMALCEKSIATIWNSNMYMSKESMELLDGVIDVYLADFRYYDDSCAMKYSKVPNYVKTVKRNLKLAHKQTEMLIRLLVLPTHIDCCAKPILDWIAKNLGEGTRVNIMSQYTPHYRAAYFPEIDRKLTRDEYFEVVEHAKKLEMTNLLVQGFPYF
jgi:putative pyruvate formate lyase activating enzyme